MSDKEMNLAILNKLYEIADKVFDDGVNVKEEIVSVPDCTPSEPIDWLGKVFIDLKNKLAYKVVKSIYNNNLYVVCVQNEFTTLLECCDLKDCYIKEN